jgi:hypothetical protein
MCYMSPYLDLPNWSFQIIFGEEYKLRSSSLHSFSSSLILLCLLSPNTILSFIFKHPQSTFGSLHNGQPRGIEDLLQRHDECDVIYDVSFYRFCVRMRISVVPARGWLHSSLFLGLREYTDTPGVPRRTTLSASLQFVVCYTTSVVAMHVVYK